MPPASQHVSDGRISVAICPGEVRAACTATAASAPTSRACDRRAHPAGDAARPALGIGGQRRVERAVIGRLVADAVDHHRVGAAAVVQVGQAVRRARARNAAASPPACRRRARSRRPRRSPRPRTGPARSACRGCGRVRPRNASPTCRDWRSTCPRRSRSSVWTSYSAPFMAVAAASFMDLAPFAC